MKKSESMNQKHNENKKAENEKVMNKAIKMVIINVAIGIFFKLPASFIPIANVIAELYFANYECFMAHHGNYHIYRFLKDTGFHDLIKDMSNIIFTLSLSIQIFI